MVGGKIEDFRIIQREQWLAMVGPDKWDIDRGNENFDYLEIHDLQLVKFLVYDDTYGRQYCCVTAAIPQKLFDLILIEKEEQIWWQAGKVHLNLIGVEGNSFYKLGASGGDKESFYRTLTQPVQ